MPEMMTPPGISQDKLDLAEYQLTDKVGGRIFQQAKRYVILFLAGLTLFGLVGIPFILGYLSDKVSERLSNQIDKETNRIRDRVTEDIANIEFKKAQLDVDVKEAHAELAELKQETQSLQKLFTDYRTLAQNVQEDSNSLKNLRSEFHGEINHLREESGSLEEIQSRYEDLQKQVAGLDQGVRGALNIAASSHLETDNLRLNVASLTPGLPVIFTVSELSPGNVSVLGMDFGSTRGHVFVRVRVTPAIRLPLLPQTFSTPLLSSDQVEVSSEAVALWLDNDIVFNISLEQKAKLANLASQLESSSPESKEANWRSYYEYQIETSAGAKSWWFSSAVGSVAGLTETLYPSEQVTGVKTEKNK